MKRALLVMALLLSLLGCTDEVVNGGSGEQHQFSLTEFIQRLEATGDLTAKAVIASGVIDQLSDDNYPLTLYLINEGNYALGADSAEGSSETTFEKGDQVLRTYISEQELSEEEFLNHPRLRDFIEDYFISEDATINNTRDGVEETYTSVGGREIVLSTDFSRKEGAVFANGVETTGCFFDERGDSGPNTYGRLCFAEAPLFEDFDWSN